MPKSRFMRIMMIVASALMVVGVGLMTWMLTTEDDRSVITVNLEDGESYGINFEDLCLIPGEQCEYVVEFKSRVTDTYDLTLDFVDVDEEQTLKNFARVKLMSGDEVLYDELLADAFEKEDMLLTVDFAEDKNTELTIVYYMPIDVGNDAEGAEAVFELQLTASNE